MADNDIFSGDIDPEIASLLGLDSSESGDTPDYGHLFNEEQEEEEAAPVETINDLSRESFILPEADSQPPNPLMSHPNYYKSILNGEGELSHTLHENLSLFLKEKDPKEKLKYRTRLTGQYWELYGRIAGRINTLQQEPRRAMLRYGLLLPNIVSREQREMLGSIIEKK